MSHLHGTEGTVRNADPVYRWQALQWQATMRRGSASPEYRIRPQRHPPVIFGITFLPTFYGNIRDGAGDARLRTPATVGIAFERTTARGDYKSWRVV